MSIRIDNDRICLFDSTMLELRRTSAQRVYHQPEKREFSVPLDKPWEGDISFTVILKDDDIYRMYYLAGSRVNAEQTSFEMENTFKVCYMESKDGLRWERPNLGIVEFNGTKDNNIIINEAVEFFVFKDTNPSCPAAEKYKAIFQRQYKLYCMFSADGIHFGEERLIADADYYDTLNVAFYDENKGCYVCYVRGDHRPDGREFPPFKNKRRIIYYAVRRDIRVMYSKDFLHWSKSERIKIDGIEESMQLYTNHISKYYRAPQYYIGFPVRYNERKLKWTKSYDDLCGAKYRRNRFNIFPRYGTVMTDCIFIHGKDGLRFEKSPKAFLQPGREREDGWLYGECYPVYGFVETPNDLYGYPETSLYAYEGLWGNDCKLVRYAMRPDGFVSYRADEEIKKIKTKKFIFKGNALEMNFSTSAMGSIVVQITDGERTIKSGELFGDDLAKKVWFPKGDLAKFQGKEVAMTILLKEAEVYSFQFIDEKIGD